MGDRPHLAIDRQRVQERGRRRGQGQRAVGEAVVAVSRRGGRRALGVRAGEVSAADRAVVVAVEHALVAVDRARRVGVDPDHQRVARRRRAVAVAVIVSAEVAVAGQVRAGEELDAHQPHQARHHGGGGATAARAAAVGVEATTHGLAV